MSRKLGDLPTMKLKPDRVAAFAKQADARARAEQEESLPDIEVSVAFVDELPTAVRGSAMRPAARKVEGAGLEAVPIIAVRKDDLSWFEFEADANALLAMIDGHTTVREILASVAVEPERALELLRDLELQRVIALA